MEPTLVVLSAMKLKDTLYQLSPPSKTANQNDTLSNHLLTNVLPEDGWEFAEYVTTQITN